MRIIEGEGAHQNSTCRRPTVSLWGPVAKTKGPPAIKPSSFCPPGLSSQSPPPAGFPTHLLCFVYKMICFIPVGKKVCGLLVIDSDVMIRKQARKEVVYFSGDI
jgi:hypothetical protein